MGKFIHGMTGTPEYEAYQGAIGRCTRPKNKRWYSHGARGIRFLFTSFQQFYEHIGPRPSPAHSLDRIDNNGHYEPGNVKWSTFGEQQSNKNPYTLIKRTGKGYCWNVQHKKWQARIRYMGRCVHLGYFEDEESAARSYTNKLKEILDNHEQGTRRTGIIS